MYTTNRLNKNHPPNKEWMAKVHTTLSTIWAGEAKEAKQWLPGEWILPCINYSCFLSYCKGASQAGFWRHGLDIDRQS